MVIPTGKTVLLASLGLVFALTLAAVSPTLWAIGLAWPIGVLALLAADAALCLWPHQVTARLSRLEALEIGNRTAAHIETAPASENFLNLETSLTANAFLQIRKTTDPLTFFLIPRRRGLARIERLWLRWQGPMGFCQKQKKIALDRDVPVISNISAIERDALTILSRELYAGAKVQRDMGEGTEFESLREFALGLDPRGIDWKHSARHRTLLTREFRVERNHAIVFGIDSGRLMCEPLQDNISRLDHAVNAALMMGFVSLKLGDQVGLHAFSDTPHISTGLLSGTRAFSHLRGATVALDYSAEETNYTLGLMELANRLDRRSLVILFTDFEDTTSAELMLTNLAPLMKRHVVLFVAFRDEELDEIILNPPSRPEDVTRAVIAADLLSERELVFAKLEHMGAHIVDAPAEKIGVGLINQYLKIKRQNLL